MYSFTYIKRQWLMELLSRELDKENSHSFIHIAMVIFGT